MCGCEAHHAPGKPCTCVCAPAHHRAPADVAIQQGAPDHPMQRWHRVEEPVEPWWARKLGLHFHSDDDSILVRHLYDSQTNLSEGRYTFDEVVLSYTSFSWALAIEYENQEIDSRREVWWRGLTLRVGPFSLTASRDRGKI